MKKWIAGLIVALAVGFGPSQAQAWGFDDLVKVDTPQEVQVSDGLPAKLPLSKAKAARDKYQRAGQNVLLEWDASIGEGDNTSEFFRGVTLGIGNGVLASTGGGAAILVSIAIGYLTRKKVAPQTPAAVGQEKIDSHNRGYASAIETLRAFGVKVPDAATSPPNPNKG